MYGFIVTVNIRDWLRGRNLNPVDQILVALSISNSGLAYISTVCIVWSLCKHSYRMKKTMSSEDYSWIRTHRRAARTVASLLLIYIVFYTTM
ncbi:taste receptor type 2 member 123-like [Ranitomeya variabilis]|uniref:taste receptor type 2 member 123-like n=1 Tax=Ranitomeya variabilis TaxID=490064 RepID=UPI004055EE42